MTVFESQDTIFSKRAFEELLFWASQNRKILKRIQTLISDIHRSGLLEGIGEPERLRYLPGHYSRRIDEEHCLVYRVQDGTLYIISCKGHYEP